MERDRHPSALAILVGCSRQDDLRVQMLRVPSSITGNELEVNLRLIEGNRIRQRSGQRTCIEFFLFFNPLFLLIFCYLCLNSQLFDGIVQYTLPVGVSS